MPPHYDYVRYLVMRRLIGVIKAEYKGVSDEVAGYKLMSGKVYPILTYIQKNRLVVRIKSPVSPFELQYRNLEEFCKYWRVRAVYRG